MSDDASITGRPACDKLDDCRIQPIGPGMTTCLYFPPIYDGHGNNLNTGRNKTTQDMHCSTCGRSWTETR